MARKRAARATTSLDVGHCSAGRRQLGDGHTDNASSFATRASQGPFRSFDGSDVGAQLVRRKEGPGDAIAVASVGYRVHPTLGSVTQIRLLRIDAGGRVDRVVETPLGPDNDQPARLARQRDGKLVLAAAVSSATVSDFAIVRYNADLSLDDDFGSGGALRVDFFGARDGAVDVALQPDGKLLAVGWTRNGASDVLALVRIFP